MRSCKTATALFGSWEKAGWAQFMKPSISVWMQSWPSKRPSLWRIVSVEKTLLRHRFAFTAGNMKETTADQYLLPNFQGKPKNIYLGFYLSRQWPLTR